MTNNNKEPDELKRILKEYGDYRADVYQGLADYDEATAIRAIQAIIAHQCTEARIDELKNIDHDNSGFVWSNKQNNNLPGGRMTNTIEDRVAQLKRQEGE